MLKRLVLAVALLSAPAWANHHDEDKNYGLNVTLNTDAFFGFAPFISGYYHINDSVDFTFYTIKWAGGTFAGNGNWTEYGFGATYKFSESLSLNAQLGVLNGTLASASNRPRTADGIVPNLTFIFDSDSIYSELYVGYYMGLEGDQDVSSNFLHTWYTGGYKLNSFFSFGAHWEQLSYNGGKNRTGTAKDSFIYYSAVGPYVQFSDPKGSSFVRFAHGIDVRSKADRDLALSRQGADALDTTFWKVTVGFGF